MFEEGKKFQKEQQEKASVSAEEEIYVMTDYLQNKKRRPSRYIVGAGVTKEKKTFPLWLIWIFLGLIFIAFASIFYFNPSLILSLFAEKRTGETGNQAAVINETRVTNETTKSQPQLQASLEETLRAELKENEEIIIQAELYLPENALPQEEKLIFEGRFPLTEGTEKYKVIDGIFEAFPIINLNKPLTLKISYQDKRIRTDQEDDLKIGYLKEGFWIVLPTEVDIEKNILTTTLPSLYSGTFAPLLLKEQKAEKETQEIVPGVFLGEDNDNDGLTGKEEEIFKTDKNNPDTDNDSLPDGLEIMNLYSPLSGQGTKLADTELIKIYNNQTFRYSLFYPSSFVPKVMIESEDRDVIISSEVGEFFSIVIQDNLEMISVEEWYKKQIIDLGVKEIKKTKVDDQNAVWSLDGLTLYIEKDDKIYVFTYNIGGGTIANFRSTYLMMIKSFKFFE